MAHLQRRVPKAQLFVRWWLLLSLRTDCQSVLVSWRVSVCVWTSMVRRDPLLATIVVSAGGSAVCVLSGGECCQSVLSQCWWVSELVMRTGRRHSFPVRRRSAISFKGLKVRVRIQLWLFTILPTYLNSNSTHFQTATSFLCVVFWGEREWEGE